LYYVKYLVKFYHAFGLPPELPDFLEAMLQTLAKTAQFLFLTCNPMVASDSKSSPKVASMVPKANYKN